MNENLQIDPSQLDEEWLQQPLLFDQAQEEAANCLKERDEAREELEYKKAEIAAVIRENFKEYGFDKAPAVQPLIDTVLVQEKIQDRIKKLNTAHYELAKANNLVNSLEMRKRALSKLTDLWISNYFSIPNPNRLVEEGKRVIKTVDVEEKSTAAVKALNEKKTERKKRPIIPDPSTETEEKPERKRRPKRG